MDPSLSRIRQELEALADPEIEKSSKEILQGRIPGVRLEDRTCDCNGKRDNWKEVKNRPKPEIFALCEELYRSGYMEESFIVSLNGLIALSGTV